MKISKILILLALFFLLLNKTVYGQTENPIREIENSLRTPEMNLEKWTIGTFDVKGKDSGIIDNLSQGLTMKILGCITCPEEDGERNYRPGGAIGGIANLIAAIYAHPPASSVEYFADLGKNLGIVKPAYAQGGIGFEGLKPVLSLWKAFRDIAYLLFSIIFVFTGFAIMFRVRINPQTVISIQNAIPRAIVSLILVTLSYAIAGLLIDMIYVILIFTIAALNSFGAITPTEATAIKNQYLNANLINTLGMAFGKGFSGIWSLLRGSGLAPAIVGAGVIGVILSILAALSGLGAITLPAAIGALTGAGTGIIMVLLGLALSFLTFLFRILFMLIKAYASVILLIILAPVFIVFDVFPRGQLLTKSWFLNLVANLLIFPATAFLFILCDIILNRIGNGPIWAPFLIGGNAEIIKGVIGLGILMLIPELAAMIQRAFSAFALPMEIPRFLEGTGQGTLASGRARLGQSLSRFWEEIKKP